MRLTEISNKSFPREWNATLGITVFPAAFSYAVRLAGGLFLHEQARDSEDSGAEVWAMTATEEIIVSGENFIERRIVLSPEQDDIRHLQNWAYENGYKRGWRRGFLMGLVFIGVAVLCVWLALLA